MKVFNTFIGLWLCMLFAVSALAQSSGNAPCWLQQPINEQHTGFIGIARNLHIGGPKPVIRSRYNAVERFYAYKGLGAPALADIDVSNKAFTVAKQTLYFDDFIQAGYVYSYAGLAPIPTASCPLQQCELALCSPTWLCEPGYNHKASFLGTSTLSVTDSQQYTLAIKNALKQAEAVHGLTVEAEDTYVQSQTGAQNYSSVFSRSKLNYTADNQHLNIAHAVTQSCTVGSQLFVNVWLPELAPLSSIPAETWLAQPSPEGINGAIGSVHGLIASGLLSDKVQLAIKRGLVALAQAKYSDIQTDELLIQRDASIYYVSRLTQATTAFLHARVNGIYFAQNTNEFEVFVWIVETKPRNTNHKT